MGGVGTLSAGGRYWELLRVGLGNRRGRKSEALRRDQCKKQCSQFIATHMVQEPDMPSTDALTPAQTRLLPPSPKPTGVYYRVTQSCFRSWKEFCQGTIRISKSQRSFCK